MADEHLAPPTERQPVGAGVLERALTEVEQERVKSVMDPTMHIARVAGRAWKKKPDDLFQLGMLEACLAAMRFDPTLGIDFAAYAIKRIRGAIFDHCQGEHVDCVRVSAMGRGATIGGGLVKTDVSLAERLEQTSEQLKASQVEATLATLGGMLVGLLHRGESPEDEALIADERAALRAVLNPLLAKLAPEELKLVDDVVIRDEKLADVARELGWSYDRARDGLRAVLARLATQLKALGFGPG